MRRRRRGSAAAEAERGSVTVFTILIASVVLIMVGLAVDVAGHIHAMQEARSTAREAARAGGQEIQKPRGVLGHDAMATPYLAAGAADAYLSSAGVSGSAAVTGPYTIQVTVSTTYDTKFLSVLGVGALSATGSAESRITRSIAGVEQ